MRAGLTLRERRKSPTSIRVVLKGVMAVTGLPRVVSRAFPLLLAAAFPATGGTQTTVADVRTRRAPRRQASRGLTELHRLGLRLAREEAERALARLDRLSDAERQVAREMAERQVRRVLYPVSRSLREDLPRNIGGGRRTA